jgi:DGQHR domain-containing protein
MNDTQGIPVVSTIGISVPATSGCFGEKLRTFNAHIPARNIVYVLGYNPQNPKELKQVVRKMYDDLQRPTTAKRRSSICRYLETRLGTPFGTVGGYGSISLALTHQPTFKEFPGYSGVGILTLSDEGFRMLIDGLGRVIGTLDVEENNPTLFNKMIIPVTFFAPFREDQDLSNEQLGQLFSDFNFRVFPVPARIAIALDESDLYIMLTKELAKERFIAAYGGMELKSASRGKKSSAIVVQTVLMRMARGATEGRRFQESDSTIILEDPTLTEKTLTNEVTSITEFFNGLVDRMGDRWSSPTDSIHLASVGWQALGIIHHDMNHRGLTLTQMERDHILQTLATLDWRRENPLWVDELQICQRGVDKIGNPVISFRGAGRTVAQDLINYLRKITGLGSKLDAHDMEEKMQPAA